MIDKNAILALLKSNISEDLIQEQTGVSKETILTFRDDPSRLGNMSLDTAEKLTLYWQSDQCVPPSDAQFKGLKAAVISFNKWRGAARIYFNKKSYEVWTMLYEGPGSWDEYQESCITEVYNKATHSIINCDDTVTMRQLKELCIDSLSTPTTNEEKRKVQ